MASLKSWPAGGNDQNETNPCLRESFSRGCIWSLDVAYQNWEEISGRCNDREMNPRGGRDTVEEGMKDEDTSRPSMKPGERMPVDVEQIRRKSEVESCTKRSDVDNRQPPCSILDHGPRCGPERQSNDVSRKHHSQYAGLAPCGDVNPREHLQHGVRETPPPEFR